MAPHRGDEQALVEIPRRGRDADESEDETPGEEGEQGGGIAIGGTEEGADEQWGGEREHEREGPAEGSEQAGKVGEANEVGGGVGSVQPGECRGGGGGEDHRQKIPRLGEGAGGTVEAGRMIAGEFTEQHAVEFHIGHHREAGDDVRPAFPEQNTGTAERGSEPDGAAGLGAVGEGQSETGEAGLGGKGPGKGDRRCVDNEQRDAQGAGEAEGEGAGDDGAMRADLGLKPEIEHFAGAEEEAEGGDRSERGGEIGPEEPAGEGGTESGEGTAEEAKGDGGAEQGAARGGGADELAHDEVVDAETRGTAPEGDESDRGCESAEVGRAKGAGDPDADCQSNEPAGAFFEDEPRGIARDAGCAQGGEAAGERKRRTHGLNRSFLPATVGGDK